MTIIDEIAGSKSVSVMTGRQIQINYDFVNGFYNVDVSIYRNRNSIERRVLAHGEAFRYRVQCMTHTQKRHVKIDHFRYEWPINVCDVLVTSNWEIRQNQLNDATNAALCLSSEVHRCTAHNRRTPLSPSNLVGYTRIFFVFFCLYCQSQDQQSLFALLQQETRFQYWRFRVHHAACCFIANHWWSVMSKYKFMWFFLSLQFVDRWDSKSKSKPNHHVFCCCSMRYRRMSFVRFVIESKWTNCDYVLICCWLQAIKMRSTQFGCDHPCFPFVTLTNCSNRNWYVWDHWTSIGGHSGNFQVTISTTFDEHKLYQWLVESAIWLGINTTCM